MGSELSTVSGGGRNAEDWSEARARRIDHEPPTPNVIPFGHANSRVSPPLLRDDEIHSAADDASSASWSQSTVTVSRNSTAPSMPPTTDQSVQKQQHREHRIPMGDTNSAAVLPAATAPLQQPKRTQYSLYARQMRRRGRLELLHRNSGVDFIVANEFFSRSDSSTSGDQHFVGRVHRRCGMTPMEPFLPYRPGCPLSRGQTGDGLFEHPGQHELHEVDEAPVLVSSSTAAAVISATSSPHTKLCSTDKAGKTASKAVSMVIAGVDGSSDLPPALTSSRNSSTASHDSKPSAVSGDKDGATPSPSSRPLSWRKRLLRPVSQSSSQAHSKGSATKRDPSDDTGGVISSQEEKKFKTRKKSSHPEGLSELKHPHRVNSSEAAAGASSATVGAADISIGEEALAAGMEVSIRKESLRVTGDTDGSASPAQANGKSGVGFAGEYGSFMRASASPAQQQNATGEDDGGRRSVNSGACPPRSSESSACQSMSTPPHHSGSFFERFLGCNNLDGGGDGDSNRAPATMLACHVDSKHHHGRLMRTSTGGGEHDLNDESCNDFFAPTQRSGQHRMLYGTDDALVCSDDDEADLNSESGNSTASMREAARMASGGGGAMVHSFGSFFDGSRSGSLHSVSSSHGQAWIGDYADGGMVEVTAVTGVPTLYDGGGTRKVTRHLPSPGLNPSGISGASVNGAGVPHTQLQRPTRTLSGTTPPLPSPGVRYQMVTATPEGDRSAQDSPLSALPTPASVVAAEAPTSHKRVGSPAVIRGTPCRGVHSQIHAATEVSSGGGGGSGSSVFGSCSSGDSGTIPDVSARGFVGSSRVAPPAEAVSPSPLSEPSRPQTAVTRTETRNSRGGGVGGGNADPSQAEDAAASSMTPKSLSSDTSGRNNSGNASNSGGGFLQATRSVLTAVQGSGDASRPTRADSKDLILRPDRTTSANRHHSGRNDDAPGSSGTRQRRPRNRTHSSGTRLSSFSLSSDSFLYGKVRGRLAKAAAAAVAANSSSIERRRCTSASGGGGGTQAHARHYIHSDADSAASRSSPSASVRKAEVESRCDCRHHYSSGSQHHHKRYSSNTSSDRKREMRSRRHLRSGHGSGSEMGSLVAGLDDLLLGTDVRAVSSNLTGLYLRSISSSSSSLAPSSRNSSANGGVGGSGSGVGSGSVRALRKRAARARDLSASSSVDSESNTRLHSHWTSPTSPIYRLPLVTTSSSSFGAVAAIGSTNGAAAGGACGMKLPSFKLSMGVEISTSTGASTDHPASSGGCRLTSEHSTVVRPHHLTHQHQQQPRIANTAPHDPIGKGHSNSSDRPSQPLRSPAALPEMHKVAMSHRASLGVGVAANNSVPMPMINGYEVRSRRPAMATNVAGAPSNGSVGGAHLPRIPPPTPSRHASSKIDSDGDSVTVSFLDVNNRGNGAAAGPAAAASLLAGSARDSSSKRRRLTTQTFTPWSVDMSRFKALQEAQESSS